MGRKICQHCYIRMNQLTGEFILLTFIHLFKLWNYKTLTGHLYCGLLFGQPFLA